MAGRNAHPFGLIEGKKDSKGKKGAHRSNKEKQQRKDNEIKLTQLKIKASDEIKGNPKLGIPPNERAMKEFKRLKKLYTDIKFVGSLDEYLINQYCLAVSELEVMTGLMRNACDVIKNPDLSVKDKLQAQKQILEIGAELRLKRQQIVSLGDRLYLNPVSRTKNLPKAQPKDEPKNPMEAAGFNL